MKEMVEAWMQELAKRTEPPNALPDAAVIWWRAHIVRQQAAQIRASQPVRVIQKLALVVCAVASALLMVALWPEIQRLSDTLLRSGLQPLAALSLGIALAVALILSRAILAEH